MASISVVRFGEVPQSLLDKVLKIMDGCYELLGEPAGGSVDLHVFEKAEGETFFATHDALQGKPKITIYLNKFWELPETVGLAGLRRQVAHSVLHGSPEFYLIKFPEELRRAMKEFSLPPEFANRLLYGAGMAAKEYKVTGLLYEKGFIEDQVAYAEYILKLSNEDILSWEIASRNKLEKLLHLISILRDVSCAIPLVNDERSGSWVKGLIERRVSHLTLDYSFRIQKIVYKKFPPLRTGTMEGIHLITKAVVEEIVGPELS